MPVRNEAWCLGLTLRVALEWCDEVIVLIHASTDESHAIACDIAREFSPRVTVVGDDKPIWDEMRHRQSLLELARSAEIGATHVAIVDADEFVTANLVPGMRRAIEATPPGFMLELPGYNTRGAFDRYHANGIWGNRWFSTAFVDTPALHWAGDRFHKREPFGCSWQRGRPFPQGVGGTIHLWGASERRLRAKHALYKITERLRWPEKPVAEIDRYYNYAMRPEPEIFYDFPGRYLNTVAPQPWTFAQVPDLWLFHYEPWIAKYLHVDAEPWQEAEVRSLLGAHGREHFAGLDLLGY
jgi:hypothetical protein